MSRLANKLISASGGEDAYEIDQSIMLDAGDTPKLRRTPSSAGNRRTFTFSTWCKRSSLGKGGTSGSDYHYLFGAYNPGTSTDSDYFSFGFNNNDEVAVGVWTVNYRYSNRKFRDTSAWYHLLLQVDTTQGTANDRVKIYINGVQETSFHTLNNPSQNLDLAINNTVAQSISDTAYDQGTGPYHFPGYLAETHLFDGAVVAASEFGETDSVTGEWIPKKYEGTTSYGTNGYYIPWKKSDRYSPYFNANASSGILTADHADFAVGSGNFTIECWFYVDEYAGNYRRVFGKSSSTGANAHTEYQVDINASNQPVAYVYDAADSGTSYLTLQSSTAITDNKWHHVALVRNGTAFNLYQDGTSVANVTSSMTVNDSTYKFGIGRVGEYASQIFKGWISNLRFVKGTAVYTSNFTPPTSPLTAITNTKLLCCQDATITTDNSGTSKTLEVTAAQVRTEQTSPFTYDWYQDQSGQDNHYQPDNLTVRDVMLDSPTNNFSTLNSLMGNAASGITLTQGNLKAAQASLTSETAKAYSTMAFVSGKWYAEVSCSAANVTSGHGVVNISQSSEGFDFDSSTNNVSVFTYGALIYKNGSQTQSGLNSTASSTNILGIALDLDNGTVQFYSNGSTSGSAETLTRNTGDIFVFCDAADSSGYASNSAYEWNFGQNGTHSGTKTAGGNTDGNGIGNYMYSVPSGFLAPCSSNLAAPAIKKSSEHFNTVLWTGDGTDNRSITGVGFQPDLTWIKPRSEAQWHNLYDAIRGANKAIYPNDSYVEETLAETFESFAADGFTVSYRSQSPVTNKDTITYVAWNWKANGSGSANTDGSINSTVSANTTAGFSIVTFTGTSGTGTIGHGLSQAPETIWHKNREATASWTIYHAGVASDPATDYLQFNSTNAASDNNTVWNDTAPTSSVFSVGQGSMTSGDDSVAYCFHSVEGFSKFGSYIGDGTSDNGPYIYTGFKPRLVIVKKSSAAGSSWFMWDSLRHPENVIDLAVWVDATNGDTSHAEYEIDFLSNGFKIRGQNAGSNASGETHIYMAWAESPIKYANAR